MQKPFYHLASLLIPVALLAAGRTGKQPNPAPSKISPEFQKQAVQQQLASLPVYFEPNRGQTDPSVSYMAKVGKTRFFLTRDSAVFVLNKGQKAKPTAASGDAPAVVRMRTVNAQRGLDEGLERLPGVSNYLIGNDSSKWVSGIPQFAKLKRSQVYPGIDMVFYGNQRQLEYDFVVGPGADPNRIELAFDGVDSIRTNAAGDLVLATSAGDFIQKKPKVYQKVNGGQVEVASRYRLLAGKSVRFEVASYDRQKALVIDPTIIFNAIIGGSVDDFVRGVAVDSSLNTYVAGEATGSDFPLFSALQSTFTGSRKIFVFKLNSSGSALLYSTYLGGESNDYASGISVDGNGNAIVAGNSFSTQYPVVAAAQSTGGGASLDGVLSKLSASGGALLYSTYLGGAGVADQINSLALDPSGNAYVAGLSFGSGFPVTGSAFQRTFSGGTSDCIIAKYTTTGSLTYASYLGGSDLDECNGIAADAAGNAYVAGRTQSLNFPVTPGAFQSTNASANGGTAATADAFVAKINSAGTATVYATYFGGSSDDQAFAIAVDSSSAAYVTGATSSTNLPAAGTPFQASKPGSVAAFVAKFSSGGGLSYRTYLGGNSGDNGYAIAVDAAGNAYVVGSTTSTNFPTLNPVIAAKPGAATDYAGFATELNSTGSNLVYSTFVGGQGASPNTQYAYGIALDSSANAYIVGGTDSLYFKNTPGALNAAYGGEDLFILKLSPATNSCVVSFAMPTLLAYQQATVFPVEVFAPTGCLWTAVPNQPWVTLSGTNSATGTASMTINVAANTGIARSTTVGFTTGQSITINQVASSCTYAFSPASASAANAGGTGTASLTATAGCAWQAVSNSSWITVNTTSGTGTGAISYSVAPNSTTTTRTGTISVSNQNFTITQAAAAQANYVGYADAVSCSGISGWAADRNRLNTSITVTLWDGGTQLASTTANGLRTDIGTYLGDNGLHAFSFPYRPVTPMASVTPCRCALKALLRNWGVHRLPSVVEAPL